MVKLPSKSVEAPIDVFLRITFTPGKGIPEDASIIVPVTVTFCPYVAIVIMKAKSIKNFIFIS